MKLKSVPEELLSTGRYSHQLVGERVNILLLKEKDILAMRSVVKPNSIIDFKNYIYRVSQRFDEVINLGGIELLHDINSEPEKSDQIPVSITLSDLFPLTGLSGLIDEFNINPFTLKFAEQKSGFVEFCPYPIPEDRKHHIPRFEDRMKEYHSVFKYPIKLGAIYGLIPVERISSLLEKKEVFLVDPGPIEIYQEYKKFYQRVMIGPSLDCFYWVNKFPPDEL